MVGKGENPAYQYFILFQYNDFVRLFLNVIKSWDCVILLRLFQAFADDKCCLNDYLSL